MTADMGLGRKLELFLLDLLYPNACPCCGKSLPWQAYLCETCQTELLAYPADAFVHSAESLSMTAFAAKDWRMTGRWH